MQGGIELIEQILLSTLSPLSQMCLDKLVSCYPVLFNTNRAKHKPELVYLVGPIGEPLTLHSIGIHVKMGHDSEVTWSWASRPVGWAFERSKKPPKSWYDTSAYTWLVINLHALPIKTLCCWETMNSSLKTRFKRNPPASSKAVSSVSFHTKRNCWCFN